MYLEVNPQMKQCINYIESKINSLPKHRRQWLWFAILWLSGLTTVLTLGYLIRLMMGI
jgi:hypothetical protein